MFKFTDPAGDTLTVDGLQFTATTEGRVRTFTLHKQDVIRVLDALQKQMSFSQGNFLLSPESSKVRFTLAVGSVAFWLYEQQVRALLTHLLNEEEEEVFRFQGVTVVREGDEIAFYTPFCRRYPLHASRAKGLVDYLTRGS